MAGTMMVRIAKLEEQIKILSKKRCRRMSRNSEKTWKDSPPEISTHSEGNG